MTHTTRSLLVIAAMASATPVWGQAVPSREPTGTHIFPAGGQRGTVVKVRVGGECLPPGMTFQLLGDGLKAPPTLGSEVKPRYEPSARRPPRDADGIGANTAYPREWASEIEVAADAAPGMRFWRVSGAWGGTRPLPFVVGDLPEFIETEPNSRPDRAERVTLPVVVNGQIAGERDEDYFVFAAKAGEVVVCDVAAARIGSPLDPVITITDAKGGRLTVQEVRVGSDPVVAFRAPATGDYRLHVANLGFAGGPAYVYRITLSTASYAPFAFPTGGKAGEKREVEFYSLTGTDSFRVLKEKVAFPQAPGPFRHRGITLLSGVGPELTNEDADKGPDAALELTAPVHVSGRFLTATETDWYRFRAKKGEAFTLTCEPIPRDSAAVPILSVLDAAGASLATASAATSPDRGVELEWRVPVDGTYRLRLRDLQHGTRGGPEFGYRLTVTPAKPDFALRLEPDYVNVVQGGKTEIDLIVRRTGGFVEPIDLTGTGLPEGVTIEPSRIPAGATRMKLAVSAKPDTRPVDVAVGLTGRATIAGATVERNAAITTFGMEGSALYLTVQHKPVFKLTCNEAYQYAHRGTIYPYAMSIERLDGFDGPITLQLCDRQVQDLDGIEVVETVVPPNATEAKTLIFLPETMFAGVQHHSRPYVQGYATFVDRWGEKQTLLAVCDKRCMVRTLPPIAKLRAVNAEVEAVSGGVVECKLVLDRTSNFTGPATVELIGPAGLMAEPVHVKAGESAATVRVRIGAGPLPSDLTLKFRATGKLTSGATLASEAMVLVRTK